MSAATSLFYLTIFADFNVKKKVRSPKYREIFTPHNVRIEAEYTTARLAYLCIAGLAFDAAAGNLGFNFKLRMRNNIRVGKTQDVLGKY